MKRIIALALKDLRLMPRNKGGMFFTFAWPIALMVLFGFAFSGNAANAGAQNKVRIAIVDDDNSDGSRQFAKKLEASFDLLPMTKAEAETAVRLGQRAAFIAIKPGFGQASERMFYGSSREIEVGVDPARQAEAGMIEGLLMKHAAADLQKAFTDPAASARMADKALAEMPTDPASAAQVAPVRRFLGELKTFTGSGAAQAQAPGQGGEWQPLKITTTAVARERRGPDNAFDVTFPQGIVWGLIGCEMTIGISLLTERTHGTLVRLRMAPLTRAQILGGKALACFVTIMIVEVILLAVAFGFGVRPSSMAMLTLAGLSSAICFVGLMMLIASLGKTEQTASGAGWAILMPLSMLGGAMVPQFVMPQWMQTAGMISPIRWVILAIEGGIWRQFTLSEMAMPCAILIAVGVACFAIGTRGLREA
jgi:ABC-2 type transport system permease protein